MLSERRFRNQLTSWKTDRVMCTGLVVRLNKTYIDFVINVTQLLGADPEDTLYYYEGEEGCFWVSFESLEGHTFRTPELKVRLRAKILDNFEVFKAYKEMNNGR